MVREGLFVIIFDGFDELCLHPQFSGGPDETINELVSYIYGSDNDKSARILLTAREAYWNSIIDDLNHRNLKTYRLLGFSNSQKQEYFRAYYRDRSNGSVKIDTAMRISREVGGRLFQNTETVRNKC